MPIPRFQRITCVRLVKVTDHGLKRPPSWVDFGGGKKHHRFISQKNTPNLKLRCFFSHPAMIEWMMCPPMFFFSEHLAFCPIFSFWPWIPWIPWMDLIAHNAAISNSAKQLRWQLALQHWDEIFRRRDQRTFGRVMVGFSL